MKKFLKILLVATGCGIAVSSPFASYFWYGQTRPMIYGKTYYAALVDKVVNLSSKKGKKIILIGGSNVAFGFQSSLIQKAFPEYSVINFGLYAALGTKIMLDLSKSFISSGDMVFIIPEINDQSMSLYFSPVSTWKALETDEKIIRLLPEENQKQLISFYPSFIKEKESFSSAIVPSGVYQRINFSAFGDIEYLKRNANDEVALDDGLPVSLRTNNRMPLRYDAGMMVSFALTPSVSFVDYLNDYSSYASSKGAKTFYSWSPVNSLAVNDENSAEIEKNLYWNLRNRLSFPVVGNPLDFVMDPHWFYDSNFHLNDSGAIYRTLIFDDALSSEVFGIAPKEMENIPKMPDYPTTEDLTGTSESAKYFTYSEFNGQLVVSGMSQEGKALEEITLPSAKENRAIVALFANALSGSSLTSVSIPRSFSMLQNGCFSGATKLEVVHLLNEDPTALTVNYMGGLFEGANPSLKIRVPKGSLGAYKSDYNWSVYSGYLEEEI